MHTLPSAAFLTGRTPLVWAITCDGGNVDIVRYLLDHGANPDNVDTAGFTPLHEAAKIGNSLLSLLLFLCIALSPLLSSTCLQKMNVVESFIYRGVSVQWMKRNKRDCNCGTLIYVLVLIE
jgi:ankyrin repeat protein